MYKTAELNTDLLKHIDGHLYTEIWSFSKIMLNYAWLESLSVTNTRLLQKPLNYSRKFLNSIVTWGQCYKTIAVIFHGKLPR